MLEVFENNASRICTTIEELKSLEASYITNIDSEDETNELVCQVPILHINNTEQVSCSRRSLGYFPQPPRNSTSTTCNSQQKDVVQHPHRDAKGAVIAGNLFLREKKLWTKKFCEVTCDAEFLCFDVQNKKKLEYHFCIPGAVVRRTISREHQYAFQVEVFQVVQKKKKKKVTYYFYTTSKEDMSKWIKGIVNQGAELKEPRVSFNRKKIWS